MEPLRDKAGRLLPGAVINPKGRPIETVKSATLRKRIMKAAPEVVDALIEAAKAGDVNAARALLVCACPPLKAIELPVTLPMPEGAGLADQGRAVVAALSTGLIAPGQAASILQALAGIAKLVELEEFERRLAALEGVEPGQRAVGPDWNALTRSAVVYVEEPPG